LKRPKTGKCYFRPEEKPQLGLLSGDCVFKQSCNFRQTLKEAKDACLANDRCLGITFVPWEDRYELRDGSIFRETFDGQLSYVKGCDEGKSQASNTEDS